MANKYFSVLAKYNNDDGSISEWTVQFGDFDKSVALEEANDMKRDEAWAKITVICTEANQAAINDAVALLNVVAMA